MLRAASAANAPAAPPRSPNNRASPPDIKRRSAGSQCSHRCLRLEPVVVVPIKHQFCLSSSSAIFLATDCSLNRLVLYQPRRSRHTGGYIFTLLWLQRGERRTRLIQKHKRGPGTFAWTYLVSETGEDFWSGLTKEKAKRQMNRNDQKLMSACRHQKRQPIGSTVSRGSTARP